MKTNIYKEKVKQIDLSELLWIIESDVNEDTEEYSYTLNSNKMILDAINEIIKELDFNNYDYITRYGNVYWCGILTAEPFCELNLSETDILNTILHENVFCKEDNKKLLLEFVNLSKASLYRFFNKYKKDGYGSNIPYSINCLLEKVKEYIKNEISNNLDKYGEWQEILYCPKCYIWTCGEDGKCEICNTELTYPEN